METGRGWKELQIAPTDDCDAYLTCGMNSYCVMNPLKVCSCMPGFQSPMRNQEDDVSRGNCVRKSPLTCVDDSFQLLTNMKFPKTDYLTILYKGVGFEECKERCLKTCNCTAFADTDMPISGRSCVMWTQNLTDTRRYSTNQDLGLGQNLYVKVAALDMERKGNNQNKKKRIIGFTVGASVLLLLIVVTFCYWKRNKSAAVLLELTNQNLPVEEEEEEEEGWTSSFMKFDVISLATDNFSNEIGTGGFGKVYKGKLRDGQDVAVKRISDQSNQAIQGFWNEVKLIAVVQHTNLVRLIGFFHDPETKILVYEYLPRSSLNTYIYNTTRSYVLDWKKRMDIAKGIARGILYLHEDSRFRIVHLDLKLSNVLLCEQMVPKLSDFGAAKILDQQDSEAVTRSVVGTYGYMAPEYATYGVYSAKADVFSFGVMLLEMVSGIKINEFLRQNDGQNFICSTWNLWRQGKGLEIVDAAVCNVSTYQPQEALRCIQIGLLCVQANPEDRPTMAYVILMLGSRNEVISLPKSPAVTDSLPGQDPQYLSTIVAR